MKDKVDDVRAVVHLSSTAVQTVIGRVCKESGKTIEIIAAGIAHTDSFFGGQIDNREHLLSAIHKSLHEAMDMAGIDIFWVGLSFATPMMSSKNDRQTVQILHNTQDVDGKGIVSRQDVQAVFEQAKRAIAQKEQTAIQVCSQFIFLDESTQVKNAVGMHANQLTMNLHCIALPQTYHKQMVDLFAFHNIEVYPWLFDGVASACYALTEDEKERGVLFVDVGAGTTSICLYKEQKLLFSHCLAIGGRAVDLDIADRFQLSLLEAESLKKNYGSAYAKSKPRGEFITIKKSDGNELTISVYELATVMEARYSALFDDIIEMINDGGLGGLMDCGMVLAGGACHASGLTTLLEENIQINVRKMNVSDKVGICIEHLKDDNIELLNRYLQEGELHSALGTLMYQYTEQYKQDEYIENQEENKGFLEQVGKRYKGWFGFLKRWM